MLLSKHVESFLTVAECKSIQEAASRLYISSSALSQQISLLEKEIGVALLKRNYKGIELTPAGKVFRDKMKIVSETAEDARQLAQLVGGANRPALKVAYTQSMNVQEIYDIYSELRQGYAQELSLVALSFSSALEATRAHLYDACFIPSGTWQTESGLAYYTYKESKPNLAVPKDHPLAGETKVSLQSLNGIDLVLPHKGTFMDIDAIYEELEAEDVKPNIILIDDVFQTEMYCVTHKALRICLNHVFSTDMVIRELDTSVRNSICLAYRKDHESHIKLQWLLRVLGKQGS